MCFDIAIHMIIGKRIDADINVDVFGRKYCSGRKMNLSAGHDSCALRESFG